MSNKLPTNGSWVGDKSETSRSLIGDKLPTNGSWMSNKSETSRSRMINQSGINRLLAPNKPRIIEGGSSVELIVPTSEIPNNKDKIPAIFGNIDYQNNNIGDLLKFIKRGGVYDATHITLLTYPDNGGNIIYGINVNDGSFSYIFYCKDINVSDFPDDISKYDIYNTLYDYRAINENIFSRKDNQVIDDIDKNYNRAVYNNYLYNLLLIEFVNYVNTNVNEPIREEIINGIKTKGLNAGIIKGLVDRISDIDYEELSKLITESINSGKTNQQFINIFTNNRYEFDRHIIAKIKAADSSKKGKEILQQELNNIVEVSELTKDPIVDNIYIACKYSDNDTICSNKKLIISPGIYPSLVDILYKDIINSITEKYLFTGLYNQKIFNYMKFNKSADSEIFVYKL
jgi:hypothetical protein